jgi:hypothetical protein
MMYLIKSLVFISICWLAIAAPAWAVNIAWLGMHGTDAPVAQSMAQGYTAATDQGYVDLLRGAGHTVTRYLTQSPTAAFIDTIDNADLIIVSRQVASADYQDDPERVLWHGVTKPMILMSGYILRNNRLQFMAGDNIPDASVAGPVTLTATTPSHPIFQGVTLDGSNNMTFATYPISTPMNVAMRGISVVTGATQGNGTVLATLGGADANAGAMLIGHWPAGSAQGATALAAPRMAFLSGTREPAAPADIPLAGQKDLTPGGDKLFLNAVCFMVGGCGPPLVPGDTDGNGTVNFADFGPIQTNFRKSVTSRAQGDLVPNGTVDFADFREWKGAFLGMGGSLEGLDLGLIASVPEPTTGLLLSIAAAVLAGCRQRRGGNNS